MEGRCAMIVLLVIALSLACEVSCLPSNGKGIRVVNEINREGPRIAVVTVYEPEEAAFMQTKILKPHPKHPFIDLSGRRYRIGTIYGKKVVYVRCGVGMLNAGVTTQTLADLFNIVGVVHFGIAGNVNNSLSIGDVIVPKYVGHTGMWEWLKINGKADVANIGILNVGDYNVPQGKRTNLLGKITYESEEFYSESGKPDTSEDLLWAETSSYWFKIAIEFKGLKLVSCLNKTACLPRPAEIVFGHRSSSANIFVDNGAYRDFLVRQFQVSSVDEESAAVVFTCLSNKVKVIVFRGLSDLAGSQKGENAIHKFGPLAAKNSVIATLEFIKRFPPSAL